MTAEHKPGTSAPIRTLPDMTEVAMDSEMVYEGKILNLRVDSVALPDGKPARREVVEHRPAVAILAENDAGEVLLIHQFRYAVGETMIELPAGIVEEGEDYELAAVRELQEEAGWKPSTIYKVADFFTSPGFSNELLLLYYAKDLIYNQLPQDEDEFIVARFFSRHEIIDLLQNGDVRDAKTILGLYWWLSRTQG